MTFTHSHVDIKTADNCDGQKPSNTFNTTADIELINYTTVPKRTLSEDVRDKRLRHLSPECLAVKKTMRRYSYEIAVAEHSWLPIEPPNFASSEIIMNTYKYGGSSGARKSTVGFENKAYDVEAAKSS